MLPDRQENVTVRPSGNRRPAFTWLELVVVLIIVAVLVALILPAAQPRRNNGRNLCRNNLKQIGLALHNYHEVHGSFPPAITFGPDGRPCHSWRTLLLPFLEEPDLFARYRMDEPWNGPNNRKLAERIGPLSVFACPADEHAGTGHTSYLAVIGEGTMWPPAGPFRRDDVPDGAHRTLLLVEVAHSGVHWMEPRDLRFEEMSFEIGATHKPAPRGHGGTDRWFREDDPPVASVLLVDGGVRSIAPANAPPKILRSLLLRADGGPAEEF
jgi:type II secretory pathway pseudopilin PulG